jgi:hypothetical protein
MPAVWDNAKKRRYELDLDGQAAIATYRRKDGVVTFLHTEVPEALRGRGSAKELVKGALEDVRARGEKIVPRCPFVAAYVKKHPEVQDLVAP